MCVPICVVTGALELIGTEVADAIAEKGAIRDESGSASWFYNTRLRMRDWQVPRSGDEPGSLVRRGKGQELQQSWPSAQPHDRDRSRRRPDWAGEESFLAGAV